MKKYNWKKGILIGASIGALASLLHKETREGAKEWGKSVWGEMKEYRMQPSKAVSDLKMAVKRVDQIADTFVHEIDTVESLFSSNEKRIEDNRDQIH